MIEKIKAEIERRREAFLENNAKIERGEIFRDTEDDFNRTLARYGNRVINQELFELICFIESLEKEQPQGLDEAAEEYSSPWYGAKGIANESFKAGAEWMAGQGITLECLIDYKSGALVGIDSVKTQETLKDYCNKIGASRVSVQIRKA